MKTLYHKLKALRRRIDTLLNRLRFRLVRAECGAGFSSAGAIFVRNRGRLCIGRDVHITSSPRENPVGVGERTSIQVLETGELTIGDGCAISNCALICAERIAIGSRVTIGSGCRIYDTDFHSLDPQLRTARPEIKQPMVRPVTIRDEAFIGAGCFLLKGADVGRASVIGAGSVVTGRVPDGEIWAGNPARFIKKLTLLV